MQNPHHPLPPDPLSNVSPLTIGIFVLFQVQIHHGVYCTFVALVYISLFDYSDCRRGQIPTTEIIRLTLRLPERVHERAKIGLRSRFDDSTHSLIRPLCVRCCLAAAPSGV